LSESHFKRFQSTFAGEMTRHDLCIFSINIFKELLLFTNGMAFAQYYYAESYYYPDFKGGALKYSKLKATNAI
jgi:hypothetical protein